MDDQHGANLQGRILALELMMRGFMTMVAMESGQEPNHFLAQWRSELLASLQLIERPLDDYSDEVWGEAADALNALFSETGKRVSAISN